MENNLKEYNFKKIINTILGLLIIVVGIYFLAKLSIKFINWIRDFTSNTEAVIVVALITGAVSILGIIVSKIIEYRQDTKRYLYEKKEEAYSEFIEVVYKIRDNQKNEKNSEFEMMEGLINFSKKLTLWGSNEVIRKWIEIRELNTKSSSNANAINNLFLLEEIIFLIRKDLGQKNSNLKKGDILRFFINDIDDYITKDH